MFEHAAYVFDRNALDRPRRAGISAIMRIRNGAAFLRSTIESHLPYCDEIVACFNDCSDDTEQILRELADAYPEKVRPVPYLPAVHLPYGRTHNDTPTESVHSLANYYNFALAQSRYCVAVKLDDDHLAVHRALDDCVRRIRADISLGVRRLYTFSGVNLVHARRAEVAVYANQPFAGTGDHMYFPVCSQIHFKQTIDFEQFEFSGLRLQKQYMGLLYLHVKHLKPDLGFGNLESERQRRSRLDFLRTARAVSIAEFCGERFQSKLRGQHNRLQYWLRTAPLIQGLIYAVSARHPPLRICRLQRLAADVAAIDWQRDLFEQLERTGVSMLRREGH